MRILHVTSAGYARARRALIHLRSYIHSLVASTMQSMNSMMASLTRAGSIMGRAQRGLYGGKRILSGNTISHSERKHRRTWKPNVQTIQLYSELLEMDIKIKMTTYVLRLIDRMGGLDRYLLYTPDARLDSELGVKLKTKLMEAYQAKNGKAFDYKDPNAVLPIGTYVRPAHLVAKRQQQKQEEASSDSSSTSASTSA